MSWQAYAPWTESGPGRSGMLGMLGLGLYRGYIGIMEKKMETTTL